MTLAMSQISVMQTVSSFIVISVSGWRRSLGLLENI